VTSISVVIGYQRLQHGAVKRWYLTTSLHGVTVILQQCNIKTDPMIVDWIEIVQVEKSEELLCYRQ
jgi:hypothetical protein